MRSNKKERFNVNINILLKEAFLPPKVTIIEKKKTNNKKTKTLNLPIFYFQLTIRLKLNRMSGKK